MRPSGENATELTASQGVGEVRVRIASPVAIFQSLVAPSEPLDSAVRPSGENATETTGPSCPDKVRIASPVAIFQSLSLASKPPDSAVLPSGEKATDLT